jgi:hypothetical protein
LPLRHVRVGYGTIWRFFAKEKITFKKIVTAAEQDRTERPSGCAGKKGQKRRDRKRRLRTNLNG